MAVLAGMFGGMRGALASTALNAASSALLARVISAGAPLGQALSLSAPQAFAEKYAEVLQNGASGQPTSLELELLHKNGSTVWAEVTASFIMGEDDKPVGILGATRDITERRKASREREQLIESLERSKKMEALGTSFRGCGEKILVVDDVKEQREILARILSQLGYLHECAASGEEAVAYMANNSADLVILDMIMDPGIDGLETYRRILERHPRQKAIITSGFAETDRVKRAHALGTGAYVKKPYTVEELANALRAELDRPGPPV